MTTNVSAFPAHTRIEEPPLAFHPDRPQDCHVHPLVGLIEYGPYSRKSVASVFDPIQVAAIGTVSGLRKLSRLLTEFEAAHVPRERRAYLPSYPGFSKTFGVRVAPPTAALTVELPESLGPQISGAPKPHLVLAEALSRALGVLHASRAAFSLVAIVLPESWSAGFESEQDDFDLHAFVKATGARLGIPTQLLNDRDGGPFDYHCRCSVMWRLGIAFYVKAGGVPWKIANPEPETAYIGIGYAVRRDEDPRARFVVCCTQVFDADGAGLEFLAYEIEPLQVSRQNPFLSRHEMRRLMVRSVEMYQRRHGGQMPRVAVVHKSTEFRDYEVDACFDALAPAGRVELLHVQSDTLWRGVELKQQYGTSGVQGEPSNYPCARGSLQAVAGDKFLLWTQGNARDAVGNKDFFKEMKGIPSPLLVTRHAGHGGWTEPARALLALSKMNWNNDGLYDRLPVTLEYAHTLAYIAKSASLFGTGPHHVRFFM